MLPDARIRCVRQQPFWITESSQSHLSVRRHLSGRQVDLTFHTVMTTFPRACSSSRYRKASEVSLSGYVLSMTGVTWPDSMSSFRTTRSSLFGFATNRLPCWRTNRDNNKALKTTNESVRAFEDFAIASDFKVELIKNDHILEVEKDKDELNLYLKKYTIQILLFFD